MKVLKYKICTIVNCGTKEKPQTKEVLLRKEMDWNEVNEETARREAYNGEYTIVDDANLKEV